MLLVFASTAIVVASRQTVQGQGQPQTSCDSKLISYLNWEETPHTEWSLQLTRPDGGSLQYIGASHSDDATHPQFELIRQAWKDQSPTLAFFEGPDRGTADSGTETIKRLGESGFVRYMAGLAGVPTQTLEPRPQEEVNYLLSLKEFTPEQIKLFYILREANRLRERKNMSVEQTKEAIGQLMDKANKVLPALAAVLPDIASLQPAYAKYWSAPANWWEAPTEWFTPGGNGEETGGKFTNAINRHSSEFRNLHMYRLLTDAVLRGERVFAVVGRNHVPMQAEAIRCTLQ